MAFDRGGTTSRTPSRGFQRAEPREAGAGSRGAGANPAKPSEKPLAAIGGRWTEAELVAMVPELLSSRHIDAAGVDAYAGIGSRETPDHVLAEMTLMAGELERRGFRMRSGGAGGADTAFERGVADRANKDVILPWKGFSGISDGVMLPRHLEAQAEALALKYHPAPERLFENYGDRNQRAKPALKLHTRNMPQVLGLDLASHSKVVICYTPDGAASGGTGQAIRVAEDFGVPVLNLRRPAIREAVLDALGIERQQERGVAPRAEDVIREEARQRGSFMGRVGAPTRQADLFAAARPVMSFGESRPFDLKEAVQPETTWSRSKSAVFFKVREENGDLSNMSNDHPYEDGGVRWKSSEAQFQAMRFPHRPDIQEMIHAAPNAMASKIVAREHMAETRPDWQQVNVEAMAYVLTRKLRSDGYARSLAATEGRPIVEHSSRDKFWGAMGYEERMVGQNVLGRLQVQSRSGARQDELPRGTTLPGPELMANLRRARVAREEEDRSRRDGAAHGLSEWPPRRGVGDIVHEKRAAAGRQGMFGSVAYVKGDVSADRADVIVNTVNARLSPSGNPVMGKGVALAFKQRFPSILADYKRAIQSGELREGRTVLFDLPDGRKWAAVATKADWRDESRMEWVESALKELGEKTKAAGLRSVALPPPGCGNGGLDWAKVEPMVHRHLSGLDLTLYAEPTGTFEGGEFRSGPVARGVTSQARAQSEQVQTSPKPAMEATMYFSYGRDRREGVKSTSTFEAILAGERTSTTRFDSWKGSDRWGQVKPGTVVRMFEDKDKQGRFVDVRVTSVERIDLAKASDARVEEWSKAEGWSPDHGRASGRKSGPGWQVRYEPVPGQEILRAREAAQDASADLVQAAFARRSAFGR